MRLLASLFALSFPLMADQLSDVFARIDKAAVGFKGMSAAVKQNVHTELVHDDSVENGTIKLRRPKAGDVRVLMDLTSPDQKTVSVEGDQVKVYLPKARTVQVYDVRSRRNAVQQALLLGFGATSDEIKASYDVTWVGAETLNGQAVSRIRLVPRSKEVLQNIKQTDLWILNSGGYPIQQRALTSAAGDYLELTYSNIQINPSLTDKDLKLSVPKGVQTTQVGK